MIVTLLLLVLVVGAALTVVAYLVDRTSFAAGVEHGRVVERSEQLDRRSADRIPTPCAPRPRRPYDWARDEPSADLMRLLQLPASASDLLVRPYLEVVKP